MARVVHATRRATTDPLKHSAPLGGALAMLGIARCMPLLHGAQGCSAFAKALLTRHFREPIPLQTTALTEVSAVLGATSSLHTAVQTIAEQHHPDVIGVLTTGVTEVSGEDVDGALRSCRRSIEDTAGLTGRDGPLVITAATPDFRGGLSEGWAAALLALVIGASELGAMGERGVVGGAGADRRLVAMPTGVSLTAADLDELTDLSTALGLRPILVPDLSRSLDGHLADDWAPLTTGGTTLAELRQLPHAGAVIAVGATAGAAGAALAARSGASFRGFDHVSGLAAVDALVAELMLHGDRPVPPRIRHWRRRLADGLLDSHFVLGGARVALAGEPEHLAAVSELLTEAGATIVAAVSPTPAAVLERVRCDEVVVGDLLDLEERAGEAGAELVVASSHARAIADRLGAAHLAAGFPVYDRLGAQLRGVGGYRGSLMLLFEAANRLLDHQSSGRDKASGQHGNTRESRC